MFSRRAFLGATIFQQRRPNLVFILVDDLRWDELGCMGHPFASTPSADRLAREGAAFRNAFAVTSLCSPSRATFLTGLYPSSHGITDNTDRSAASHRLSTWPRWLHDAGYETAFAGKWHMGNDDSPRPGFDRWVSFAGQGESVNPTFNIDGRTVETSGYITDLLTDHAVEFITRPRAKPFCLYLAHKAIHPNVQQRNDGSVVGSLAGAEAFIPAERHRTLYSGRTPPRRPNYGRPPRGKPALERRIDGLPPLGPDTATSDATILNRMRMLKAVDESLGRIMDSLEKSATLDNTCVIFTSDHGYFYGEHGLDAERRLAYEETIRIPLLVRFPPLARPGSRIDDMVLSIDIAPTVAGLAGIQRAGLPGRPLTPFLAARRSDRREEFLIEYYTDTVFPRIRNMGYKAVRTSRWKYIRYGELPGMDELYDLGRDPYEINNLASERPRQVLEMSRRLDRLLDASK